MVEKLNKTSSTELLATLPNWKHDDVRGAISREFVLTDFAQAFAEWFNVYNRVTITLTTHDVKGLSQQDIDLAHYADAAFANFHAP